MPFGNTYDDTYGTCRSTHATLRIAGGMADPETISQRIGLTPTSMRIQGRAGIWRRGEWRGENSDWISRSNHWGFSTQGVLESRDVLRHIDHLLALLEGKDVEVHALTQEGWEIDVFAFWESRSWHGGPRLTPATMRRLAELNILVGFDVYLELDREEAEAFIHSN